LKFKASKPLTVGIELEAQLLDPDTYDLTDASELLFQRYSSPLVQKEFLKSMVEFVSQVHDSPEEAVYQVSKTVLEVAELGKELGFLVAASGTHPFANPSEVRITADERYERLLNEFQEVLRNFLIYGLHLHVGFPDERSALNAYNALVYYSPLFLAISASSPFFKGRNTGIYSYRSKVFEQLPRAGTPQQFHSYEQFVELYSILKESGTVESLKDVWWDVRIRPDLGTVELRVCDSVADFGRLRAIATLGVMVSALFMEGGVEPVYHQINLQNRWNGARYGLKGPFVTPSGRSLVGRELLKLVKEFGKRFGKMKEGAKVLVDLVSRPTVAELMLEAYDRSGSFEPLFYYSVVEV
jgi:carboxylate-amine ligase